MHRLPTSFVGRRREIAALHRIFADSQLVSIVGPGGSGKSRLAAHMAEAIGDVSPDGAWWVELHTLTTGQSVLSTICATLGLREQQGVSDTERLRSFATMHKAIVVLDNCEHVLESCADVLAELLTVRSELRFLVTSREPLGVAGETAWQMPAMELPPRSAALSEVIAFDAVRLFIDRARSASPSFRLDSFNVEAVVQICSRLDGLPMAVELAAAQSAALGPHELLAALDHSLGLLTRGGRGRRDRHRTMWASVEWSVALLDDNERLLLRCLAAFHGSFSLQGVRWLCRGGPLEGPSTLPVLASLVHKSLVSVEARGDQRRYRLLEVTRQYAEEQLHESGDAETILSRHLAYTVEMVENDPVSAGSPEGLAGWLKALDHERGNLRPALDFALRKRPSDAVRLIAGALGVFFGIRGYFTEGRRYFTDALAVADSAPGTLRARAYAASAYLAFVSGDIRTATEHAHIAEFAARQAGDLRAVARALEVLGGIESTRDPAGAHRHLTESAELARQVDDPWCLVQALGHIALAWSAQSELEQARAGLAAVEAIIEQYGSNQFLVCWHYLVISIVELRGGDLTAAAAAATRGAGLAAALGDPVCRAQIAVHSTEIDIRRGLLREAGRGLAEFDAESRRYGRSPFVTMFVDVALGKHASAAGELGRSRDHFEAAAVMARRSFRVGLEGDIALELADIAVLQGRSTEARLLLDTVDRCARALDNRWMSACADLLRAAVARMDGDVNKAREMVCSALAVYRDGGHPLEAISGLERLAGIYVAEGDSLRGARLFGAATAARRSLGARRTSLDRLRWRADRVQLLAALDRAELRAALSEGGGLTLANAIAYALRGRGPRAQGAGSWAGLTSTELLIARLVADGHTNPEIAQRIFVSRATVKTHLARIFIKTGVSNRAELAAEVVRRSVSDI
ncbi:helix-turn-helix transcriptional regulator [Nocardia sp. alder85J]|uniref:helix-turn-helix transcriptional regulator n=1 Tax=Nocardia sp. alder85J TaxID=2862949 RepID=UPI001CD76744|nr:LuxR C-terminal-related transcriptional regulator [Nocardia sp. alder85J]MCX4095776.1 LuxR C-terminal-related transcriptional regulator [Nocardia sp. alder85J]